MTKNHHGPLSSASISSVQFPRADLPLKAESASKGEIHFAHWLSLKIASKSPPAAVYFCRMISPAEPGPTKSIFQDDVFMPIDVMVTCTSSMRYWFNPGSWGTWIETLKLPSVGVSNCWGVRTHGLSQKLHGPQCSRHPHSDADANFDNGELQHTSWQWCAIHLIVGDGVVESDVFWCVVVGGVLSDVGPMDIWVK